MSVVRLGLLALALTLATQASAAEKTPVTVDDLFLLDGPASLTLSPADNNVAAYVRVWTDREANAERQSLWLAPESVERRRPLEAGEPDARSPVFSPDGKWIAFRSTRPRPAAHGQTAVAPPAADPATDIWLVSVAGGQAIPLAGPAKPYGKVFGDPFYSRLAFSPDGKRLAFVADDGRDPRTQEEIDNDTIVVRHDHGEGYGGYGPAQVWVAWLDAEPGEFAASRIERLTNDAGWYGDPNWSPDGRSVVVHANLASEAESVRFSINSKNFDLWRFYIEGGVRTQLTSGLGAEVSPRFSPDGKRLAYLGCPRRGPHTDVFNLMTFEFENGEARAAYDHHRKADWHSDDPAPQFPLPDDCWDGPDAVAYLGAQRVYTPTMRANLTAGTREKIDPANAATDSPSRFERDLAARRRLTPSENEFLKDRETVGAETVQWNGANGQTCEGLISFPPPSVAKPPYRLIVHPHGGPHSRSTLTFNFPVEVFCGQGYAVFQPNFRGSLGYGKKFLDADRNDFGGGDMQDILSGVQTLVQRGIVRQDAQYAYGISYGGFMTSWLVGHTPQFKAAVAQNAVTELTMMWGLSDIPSYTEWEFGGRPFDTPQTYWDHSPVNYVARVKTPTLVLHSRDDRRCPLPMGTQFYRALKSAGAETQMVIYPNEGHQIKAPKHRADVLRRVLAWFEAHP